MTRPPSRPARALRGAMVVIAILVAARVPTIRDEFRRALAVGEAAGRRPADFRAPALRSAGGDVTGAQAGVPDRVADRSRAGRRMATDNPGPAARPLPGRVLRSRAQFPDTIVAEAAGPASTELVPAPATAIASTALALASSVPSIGTAATVDAQPTVPTPFDLATTAYTRLATGDRRGAVRLFDAALTSDADPPDPRAATWRRQRDALTRHWSGSAYSIVRDSGAAQLATEPVLGGSQSGGSLAYTLDPLARRPVAAFARGSLAHDDGGRTSFAAVGVEWRPLGGVTVAAERRIATGPAGPNDWSVRVGGGADRTFGRLRATAYAEGGIVGTATYAAAQVRVAGVFHVRGIEVDPGAGVWSSVQHEHGPALDRIDTGPGVALRAGRVGIEADYRVRVAGNAAPGSGPVLTLTAGF